MSTSTQTVEAMKARFNELKVLLNICVGANHQPAFNMLSDFEQQVLREEYNDLRKKLANV